MKERYEAICATVISLRPDVACFQEVVGPFVEMLKRSREINAIYKISPNSIGSYGCLTLVRHEFGPTFDEVALTTTMGRSLILATLGDAQLVVGNVHLESLDNEATRAKQLRQCEKVMCGYENALLVGAVPDLSSTL